MKAILRRVIVVLALTNVIAVAAWPFGDAKTDRKASRVKDNTLKKNIARTKQKDGPKEGEVIAETDVKEILADTLIIDTATPEDNIKLRNDEIYSMWERNMHDFVPEDMTSFLIDGKSAETFYENISHTQPTVIKGAYYVHGGSDARPISVVVQDPQKNIIYKRSDEIQGIILFNSTVPGEYTLIFANFDDSTEKTCTLAIHTYDADEEPISYDFDANGVRIVKYDPKNPNAQDSSEQQATASENDAAGDEEIGSLRTQLRTIQTATKQVQTEAKMSLLRQDSHNEDLKSNGDWHFYAMLIEVALFMAILGFQLNHIKTSLDNKLVL